MTRALGPLARPGRCVVMGILNVTPNSSSDGGRHDTLEAAVAHGLGMVAAGADYVDLGGESTRPGAGRVAVAEELRRSVLGFPLPGRGLPQALPRCPARDRGRTAPAARPAR